MSPRIAARLRVSTPTHILLRATVQKKIELNANSSALWAWSIKIVTHLTHALVCFLIMYVGVVHSYPSFFHIDPLLNIFK